MTLDGLTLAAIVQELREKLVGSRLQQIFEPQEGLLIFECYAGADLRLLISVGENSRLHLTTRALENPQTPPAFCMLLRKYLKNGSVIGVAQPGLERIVHLQIKHGEVYTLCAEFLGQRSNVILLQNGKILGTLRRGAEKRPLRPGQPYEAPSPQPKLPLLHLERSQLLERLSQSPDSGLAKALQSTLDGIGPRLAQELAARAQLDAATKTSALSPEALDALWSQVDKLAQQVRSGAYAPRIYFEDGRPVDCAPFALQIYAHLTSQTHESISQAIDECTAAQQTESSFEKQSHTLRNLLKDKIKKVSEALHQVEEDLEKAGNYEKYRQEGDLLMASLGQLRKGISQVEVDDYQTGGRRTIALDPRLEPIANAQHKYERYKKLKRGVEKLGQRKLEIAAELQYLQEAESHLEQAEDEPALQAMAEELATEGYLPKARTREKQETASGPREYRIQGYRVFVGRSSKQNDALVRNAAREDYWLHARDRPGSHVLICNPERREVPQEVLLKAAQLAAYYSKGRNSAKVPVTYTRVKFLRKPKGARPGLVLLMQEEGTLVVSPAADI